MANEPSRRFCGAASCCLAGILLLVIGGLPVSAQVLRIGGFDFNAKARVEGVYSSNVNRERPGETSEEPEDYYYVLGLDLKSVRPLRRGSISIDTGVAEEKHFVRDDLDNSENPFGRFSTDYETQVGRLKLGADFKWEKTAESQSDQYSPGGRDRARDPRDILAWGVDVANDPRGRIEWSYRHDFVSEKHDVEKFMIDNREETGDRFQWGFRATSRFRPGYAYTGLDSRYENNPLNDRNRTKHEFLLPVRIIEKPALSYTFIWQRDDRDDGEGVAWKPRNIVELSDEWELSPTLSFRYFARYDDEQRPERDDVRFQYGASLSHQLSRTAQQSISAERQPVSTLGSTLESDVTQYRYEFRKTDLFIYGLDLALYAGYQVSVPESNPDNGEEITKRYGGSLDYRRNVTPRLVRRFQYLLTHEESNIIDDPLDEQRVTLGYEYLF